MSRAKTTDYTTDDKIKMLIASGVESLTDGNDKAARSWLQIAGKSLQYRGIKLREAVHGGRKTTKKARK